MKTTTVIAAMLVRITGIALIILGILFWLGHAMSLVNIHMLLGLILVICLWILAIIGGRAGAGAGMVAGGIIWGVIVLALGMTQTSLMPGPNHWIIRVLHLAVGLAAMALAEQLARRIKSHVVVTEAPAV